MGFCHSQCKGDVPGKTCRDGSRGLSRWGGEGRAALLLLGREVMSACLSTLPTMPSLCCLSPSGAPRAEEPMAEQGEGLCQPRTPPLPQHPGVPGTEERARTCSKGLWKRKAPVDFHEVWKRPMLNIA